MARKGLSSLFSSSSSSSSSPSSHSLPSRPQTPRSPSTPIRQTLSDSMIRETIENAQSIITKWGPDSALFHENRAESLEFLKSVDRLRHAMKALAATNSGSDLLVVAQKLMLTAMKRLEKDFYRILSSNTSGLNPESISSHYSSESSSSLDDHNLSEEATFDLKLIADCMTSSGYGKECAVIYKLTRRSVIDENLYQLGIEHFRPSHIHKMDPTALDRVIKNWLGSVKTAVRALFRGERILCDHVLSASDTIRESCFSEITREAAVNLFRLPALVAKRKQPSDRVLQLLELYDALWDVWPDIETVFSFESTSGVRFQAIQSLVKLGGSVHGIISDYESAIQKASPRALTPGGGVHPTTQSVMDIVASLTGYAGILSEILGDHSKPGDFLLPEEEMSENISGSIVSRCLARLILVLLCKLDRKAELYRDAALSYLFLANNLDYITQKVGSTDLKYLLGDEWISQHEKKVHQFMSSYEAFAWGPVFLSLPETCGSGSGTGSMSTDTVKEWFGKFNAAFENAYVRQVSWVVPDGKLRNQIKVSIANKIVHAYREFYEMGLKLFGEAKRYSNTVIRFSPDDIENYLSDLFRGESDSWVF
ncbi:exocyst complex component EXO70H1-like [Punica granatum]|uniref:Exocyst complex component EXO70H1-like n=2 Tax=Punica granatum TaxID=22663 RepID=A0A6P8BQD1_PUNGR|nr:exocyst complex component EXO70H1-like [Punica granatum]PKI74662.1 hypothetical protein CRG98_004989 [Punica granatum]